MNVISIDADGTRRIGREVERVYVALRDEITSGALAAGDKLKEPELARRFGVSRGPLREAIRRLQERGLLRCTPNAGARVVAHTPREVLDTYEMREGLEGTAARLAARHMTEDERAELRQFLEREATGAPLLPGQPNFHERVVAGSHNGSIAHILNSDFYDILRLWRKNFNLFHPVDGASRAEHILVLEAIDRHDEEVAELLMRRHVRRLRSMIENDLRVVGVL